MESHIRGNLEEEPGLRPCWRGERRRGGSPQNTPHTTASLLAASYQKAVLPSVSPPPAPATPYAHVGPGAACHLGGLASTIARSLPPQGLSLPWPACPLEGLHPRRAAPNTASPQKKACSPEKLEQAWLGHEKSCLHSWTLLPSRDALGKSLLGSQ